MNDASITAIANALEANAKAIHALIDSIPKEHADRVLETVSVSTTPKKEKKIEKPADPVPAPAPVAAAPAPVPAEVPAPLVEAPAPTAAAGVTVAAPSAPLPFSDPKSLMDWVMASYQELGHEKGMKIQDVLTSIGCPAISDVTPDKYQALYDGVKALS